VHRSLDIDLALPFDDILYKSSKALNGTILVLLDQFEEYLLYHSSQGSDVGASFDIELARSVNREEIDVNFLIGLRDDALSKLDRFKRRIPNLLANTLRLAHLSKEGAKEAIREPLNRYENDYDTREGPVRIDDDLVNEILKQVRPERIRISDSTGAGRAQSANEVSEIATPFLQLVLTRLWELEAKADSEKIRFETFKRLGQVNGIVISHLAETLDALSSQEKLVAARIFHHLVTPSGTKIAQTPESLEGYLREEPASPYKQPLIPILEKLSTGDKRILRSVPLPDTSNGISFEIYHDVLAQGILSWRARLIQKHETKKQILRSMSWIMGVLLLTAIASSYISWLQIRPWGLLRTLSTGKVHTLHNDVVTLGRSTPGNMQANVSFQPNMISRLHAMIGRNLLAFDVRSLNGTTINSEFVPYGKSKKLQDGDIIVLAGIAPMVFESIVYSTLQFWPPHIRELPPPEGWGMIIDGKSRMPHYLRGTRHVLALGGDGIISVKEGVEAGGLLTIHQTGPETIMISDADDDYDLWVQLRVGDYTYVSCKIPPGRMIRDLRLRELDKFFPCKQLSGRKDLYDIRQIEHDLFTVIYMYRDTPFQIVPIVPYLEEPTPVQEY
jgi:hypothetical protein